MRTKYSILFLLTAIGFSSCDKYLDVKPKGRLIPTETADFDKLLDNTNIAQWVFLDNNTGSTLGYFTDNLELSEGIGEVSYKANNHPNIDRYYSYIFRAPFKNPNTSDYFWDWGTYRSMAYFNNVVDGVTALGDLSANEYGRQVVAQAKVNRAWSYFITTMVYGPVYKPGGDNSRKTIPYLTSADMGAPMPMLSSQEEVFSLVFNDIHSVLNDVPAVTSWPSRPNKNAAYALLAYYHLFTRKFDSVVHYSNLAWNAATAGNAGKVIYDYNTFFWADPSNQVNSELKGPDNLLLQPNNREILFFRSTDNGAGRSSSAYPSTEYKALFNQATDLRYKYYFLTAPGYKTTYNGVTYDDGNQVQYYRGAKTQMTAGFTWPELLLMRAEGYARTNELDKAIQDLNTLRKFRYVTGTPDLTVASQDEVISMVLEERRRELPLAHFKRFLDLKRFTLDAGKPWSKTSITHTVGAQSYTGAIDSDKFILPISNLILQYNPQWGVPLDTRAF